VGASRSYDRRRRLNRGFSSRRILKRGGLPDVPNAIALPRSARSGPEGPERPTRFRQRDRGRTSFRLPRPTHELAFAACPIPNHAMPPHGV